MQFGVFLLNPCYVKILLKACQPACLPLSVPPSSFLLKPVCFLISHLRKKNWLVLSDYIAYHFHSYRPILGYSSILNLSEFLWISNFTNGSFPAL